MVKADGLAAGKGVIVAAATRRRWRRSMRFGGAFGAAGATVLIEDCLAGEEASLFALVDGASVVELGTAQDHKRVGEGDSGPNTGGMGAYAPAPCMTPELMARDGRDRRADRRRHGRRGHAVPRRAVRRPHAHGPRPAGARVQRPLRRPGNQALLPRLMTDLGQLLQGAAAGVLAHMDLRWDPEHVMAVVMAANGYPGDFQEAARSAAWAPRPRSRA